MKIAVTGKGGVGKTTVSAVLARLYAEEGKKVFAVDVDPDANLGLALGFPEKVLERMAVSYTHLLHKDFRIGKLHIHAHLFDIPQNSVYMEQGGFPWYGGLLCFGHSLFDKFTAI